MSVTVNIIEQVFTIDIIDDTVVIDELNGFSVYDEGVYKGIARSIDFQGTAVSLTLQGTRAVVAVTGSGGGTGSSTFIGLTDVPATYVGQALKVARVNAGETALEFATASSGGHVIENAGTPLTARANLNFSNGLTASDNTPDTDVKLGGPITGDVELYPNINGSHHIYIGLDAGESDFVDQVTIAATTRVRIPSPLRLDNLGGSGTRLLIVDNTGLVSTQASEVAQTITNGVTTSAPSQDAVFDALALKATIVYADAKVADAINDGTTTIAPSQNAVFDALALKADAGLSWLLASGGTLTGANTITGAANPVLFTFNTLAGGSGVAITSNSTAAASDTQKLFEVNLSGANATTTQTTYAGSFINVHSGTLSTNVAGYFESSGGATNNYAIKTGTGVILLGAAAANTVTANTRLDIRGISTGSNNIIRGANSTNTERFTVFDNGAMTVTTIAPNSFTVNTNYTTTGNTQFVMGAGGSVTLRGTSSDLFSLFKAITGITTGATTQQINAYLSTGTHTINHTGATVIGYDHNITLAGSQTPTHLAFRAVSGKLLMGTTITAGSVLADFQSTTEGILLPRVTNIASVATPVNGMLAYDAATDLFNFRQAGAWVTFPKHVRVTTGSVGAGASALITVTWPVAFADTNYTVVASVLEATTSSLSMSVVHVESKAAGSCTVRVINNAVGALTGEIQAIGIYD